MSRQFTCPSCKKKVSLDQLNISVLDLSGPPEWWCGRCKQTNPRTKWGKSNDGIPATAYYIYGGRGKHEPASQKLPRALTRNMTFGGSLFSLSDCHGDMPLPAVNGSGVTSTEVAIYHRAERYTLRGRLYMPASTTPNKVVLLLSGSGGTADEYLREVALRYCLRVGVAALLMDYRGFGKSDRKSPSEQGLFTDAEAMFECLTDGTEVGGLGWRPHQVVIHGFSLGTGVAAELGARKRHAAGVILQCPFFSAAYMAGKAAGPLASWLARKGAHFDVAGKIGSIAKPVLVLIANQDEGMKSQGMAMDLTNQHRPNLTFGYYNGEHLDPEKALSYDPLPTPPGPLVPGSLAVRRQAARIEANAATVGAWLAPL